MRSYTCPPLDSHPRPNMCTWCNSKFKVNGICLPPLVSQSNPVLVSSILLQSSSDLDTDQGVIIDKTIKQVAQSVNQMMLKTSTSNHINSLAQNDPPHDNITNRQSVHDSNPSDVHSQTNTKPIHTHRPILPKNRITHPATNFKQAKQIIMKTCIITLSHTTEQNSTGIKPPWLMQI